MSESARELVETRRKLVDIAFDYQFGSAESFSRAFKRMFGIGPSLFRRRGCLDRRFLMSPLTLRHLQYMAAALVTKTIPAGTYACFEFRGFLEDIDLILDYIFRTLLPRTGKSRTPANVIASYGQETVPLQKAEL